MWRKTPAVRVALGLAILAAVAGGQTSRPKSSRPLPPLFQGRADVAAVGKQNGATMLSEAAVAAGLDWLSRHQEPDGSWACEKFRARCDTEGYKCGGKGMDIYNVGASALAVLAFLGAGNSENEGKYKDAVKNGIRWLKEQQDAKGCFGTTEDYRYTYQHAIATLAMAEDAIMSGSTPARDSLVRALECVMRLQSPQQRGWRYADKPPDSDSTVTAWMVLPLKVAQVGSIRTTDPTLRVASEFIRRITDEKTLRTGYLTKGDMPFRFDTRIKLYKPSETESTTACGMAVKIFCGEEPRGSGSLKGQAKILLDKLPEWTPDSGRVDCFYWYFGTLAMFQLGGPEWQTWWEKMKEAALVGQLKGQKGEACNRGSWDNVDAWGIQGGRIYTTALMVMCLEAPYRYGRLFGK